MEYHEVKTSGLVRLNSCGWLFRTQQGTVRTVLWLVQDALSRQPHVKIAPLTYRRRTSAGSGLDPLSYFVKNSSFEERFLSSSLLFLLKKKEPRVRHDRHHDLPTMSSC